MGDFAIQISSNLINRLTEDEEKSKRKTKKTKTKVSQENKRSQIKKDQKPISGEYQKGENVAPRWPVQPPVFLPVTPPTHSIQAEIDAIQSTLRESEKIVDKLQKHEETMVQEVTRKAKDLHDKEFKIPDPKPMPCLAESDAWKTCYKENQNDVMRCAPLAKNFADCARRVRQLVSSAGR